MDPRPSITRAASLSKRKFHASSLVSLNGVSISGSESCFPEPRLHYKSEPRIAQELSSA